jgi:benzodiazapine receptor
MIPSPERHWKPVLIAAVSAIAVAALGALMTDLGPWYAGLRKPSWQPPDWLFGPVWTTIFTAAAIAALFAWRRAPDRTSRTRMVQAFVVNLILNVLWSLLFFRLRRPDYAFAEVALLWASIATIMFLTWTYSRVSSLLLVPYLAWVSFAAFLNLTIVRLNAPFGGS